MITLDVSLLTAALTQRSGAGASQTSSSSDATTVLSSAERRAQAARKSMEEAAPWTGLADLTTKETDRRSEDLARNLLNGSAAISETVRRAGAPNREDARQLFAVYQGLASLKALAQRVETGELTETERARTAERFQKAMGEVGDFIADLDPKEIVVTAGAKPDTLESRYALARGSAQIVSQPLVTGSASTVVPGMEGDVRFTITVNAGAADQKLVSVDLADLGGADRTLNAIVNLVNTKFSEQNVATRLVVAALGPDPSSGLEDPPQRYGIRVSGFTSEKLTFTPATPTAGVVTLKTTETGAAFVKLSDNGASASQSLEARAVDALGGDLKVRAAAQGADGSVYLVGETEGQVQGGLGLKAARDAVLIKLDSTGRQVWARTLGATESAEGFSVAVGADGRVAVAGAARGRIDGLPATSTGTDGFVAAFAADGDQLWTRQLGDGSLDEARAVAIAADGTVFVGGRTNGTVNGAAGAGGTDAFLAAFEADGAQRFIERYGTAGEDGITALAATADGGVVAGGKEAGLGVVRRVTGAGVETWRVETAALGAGGAIRSIAVAGSQIAVGGVSEYRSDLGLGAPVAAAGGGASDGFVLGLTDGGSAQVDFTTFVGGAGADAVSSVSIAGGAIYLSGQTTLTGATGDRALTAKLTAAGAEVWRRTDSSIASAGQGIAALSSVNGFSALDRLGLPTGKVEFESAVSLTERTSLRAGDHFFVRVDGGAQRRIEVQSGDTMTTLARRVNAALRIAGEASVSITTSGEKLRIVADEGRRIEIEAGGAGRDALRILGLQEGTVARDYADVETAIRKEAPQIFGLGFDASWALTDATAAANVRRQIESAQFKTRLAFEGLYTEREAPKKGSGAAADAPAYLQSQIANYAAGLARLEQGSSSSSSSSTDITASLFL